MSKRRGVLQHQKRLAEILSIVNAMKNLAFLETRKLTQRTNNLHAMREDMSATLHQLRSCFPHHAITPTYDASLWVALGSERGFCGDFNETLLRTLQQAIPPTERSINPIIAVGSRLSAQLNNQNDEIHHLTGATVAEEIFSVLTNIVNKIDTIQKHWNLEKKPLGIQIIFQDLNTQRVEQRDLLQPFRDDGTVAQPATPCPPLIQLPVDYLYSELLQQYFFFALQSILTESLMLENQRRIQHMEGATRHLEKAQRDLGRRYQQLRQEEITEEIEVIILNTKDPTEISNTDAY